MLLQAAGLAVITAASGLLVWAFMTETYPARNRRREPAQCGLTLTVRRGRRDAPHTAWSGSASSPYAS